MTLSPSTPPDIELTQIAALSEHIVPKADAAPLSTAPAVESQDAEPKQATPALVPRCAVHTSAP
jgi:hypothetical protein